MGSQNQSQSLQNGTRIKSKNAEYTIKKVLGAGSFGITYLASALHGNIEFFFAIKEFFTDTCYRDTDGATVLCTPQSKSDVDLSKADFIVEALRLQRLCLRSRNIVSVNEVVEANNTAYYVMEYLNGGNPGIMTEADALALIFEVAQAVAEIHAEKVLHLDIKPENIVLKSSADGSRYPVLIDFGISKHFDVDGHPTSNLNAKGASSGYAPQEQYAGIKEFSPKYDIYALGGVLLYLLSGKNPPDAFKISPSQKELKALIPETVSRRTRDALLHAMAPSAFERTETIEDFMAELGMKITKEATFLNLLPNKFFLANTGQSAQVKVESDARWQLGAVPQWLKVDVADNAISLTAEANPTPNERKAKISVTADSLTENFTVTQAASVLDVAATKIECSNEDSIYELPVQSNLSYDYRCDDDWIEIGRSAKGLKVRCRTNKTAAKREATITITAGVISRKVLITQEATELEVSPAHIEFESGESVMSISIKANLAYTCRCKETWVEVTNGKKGTEVRCQKNKITKERQTEITVTAGDIVKTITVKQKAYVPVSVPTVKITPKQKSDSQQQTNVKPASVAKAYTGAVQEPVNKPVAKNDSYQTTRLTQDGNVTKKENSSDKKKHFPVKKAVTIGASAAALLIIAGWLFMQRGASNEQVDTADTTSVVAPIKPAQEENIENKPEPQTVTEEQTEADEKKEMTDDEKFVEAQRKGDYSTMLQLASAGYQRAFFPVAQYYYNRKDKTAAERWARKALNYSPDRNRAQNLLAQIAKDNEPQKETENLDELFKNAKTTTDYLNLANKGYAKAYAPLASKYLASGNYANADKYARMAANARVGVAEAKRVADTLQAYGYYDNGEHGGYPKNLK